MKVVATHECHSEPQAKNLSYCHYDYDLRILRLRLMMTIGTQSIHNK